MNIDNSDFSIFLKMLGYMIFPIISIIILFFCIGGALIIYGIIWGIYGLIRIIKKLIKEKRWNVFIAVGIIILILTLTSIIIVNRKTIPSLENNTVGYISYDYNSDEGYTIYIKENNEYIPYLVLTYNYNKTNNTLCLRKNVIGRETGYIEDYNGTISKDIVYNSWLLMKNNVRYEENDVDKYLTGEFLERFDNKLLSNILNTKLTFFEYDENREYEINRKFFILSFSELDSYGNQTKSKMKLKYFEDNSRIANNDIGIESPYWTRTSHYSDSYYMVGYDGMVTYTGSDARFGVRPAFTIPNNTKITNLYDEFLMQDIYVFDI